MQSVEMNPMFLPDVQNNPQPSPYFDLIRSAQNSGQEYWQIWHLFAFRPEMTAHLARFTHAVMHEPAPLNSGLRELIAAYTSNLLQISTKSPCPTPWLQVNRLIRLATIVQAARASRTASRSVRCLI
jgi:hypothetical protein